MKIHDMSLDLIHQMRTIKNAMVVLYGNHKIALSKVIAERSISTDQIETIGEIIRRIETFLDVAVGALTDAEAIAAEITNDENIDTLDKYYKISCCLVKSINAKLEYEQVGNMINNLNSK